LIVVGVPWDTSPPPPSASVGHAAVLCVCLSACVCGLVSEKRVRERKERKLPTLTLSCLSAHFKYSYFNIKLIIYVN